MKLNCGDKVEMKSKKSDRCIYQRWIKIHTKGTCKFGVRGHEQKGYGLKGKKAPEQCIVSCCCCLITSLTVVKLLQYSSISL